MASGQTQYYGLSQWEAADKVERVDFNSDNARVDEALHTLAEGAVWEKNWGDKGRYPTNVPLYPRPQHRPLPITAADFSGVHGQGTGSDPAGVPGG